MTISATNSWTFTCNDQTGAVKVSAMTTPTTPTTPTTLEIVRNIEQGYRKQAADQITSHPEPARMAIAVLATLANDAAMYCDPLAAWQDATTTVVRTLNAGGQ